MWLVSWLGDYHVSIKVRTDHRDLSAPTVTSELRSEKGKLCVSSAKPGTSVWEDLLHENHELHVSVHTGVRDFWKRIFSVEAWRKSRASPTCRHLSLVLACPRMVWHCNVVCVCVCVCFILRSYDVVLWGTLMCTSFCRQVVRCGAVRYCNVYLSLLSYRIYGAVRDTVMCTSLCYQIVCVVLWDTVMWTYLCYQIVYVVLWDTVMCTSLCPRFSWCIAVRYSNVIHTVKMRKSVLFFVFSIFQENQRTVLKECLLTYCLISFSFLFFFAKWLLFPFQINNENIVL